MPGANTDEVFLSGLLQNLGELILIRTLPDEYKQILAEAEDDQESLREKEIETFGASHTEIGYEAAKRWGFPDTLLLPILYHHNPTQHTSEDKTLQQLIHATYLSDLLTSIIYNPRPGEYHERFMKEAEELLDLDPEAIDDILAEVNQEVAQAGEYFGLKIKHTKSIKEILQEANISLSLMNLDYDQMNKQLVQAKLELEKLTEELQEKNRVLDNLANCDGLTGAFNHRYFQNSLDAEINKAKRHNRALSLIIMDIDDFKKFNDTYGHQTGDFVLKNFCKIIKENLREYDMLARYGGEEFAVILSDSDVGDGLKVGGKLRKAIDETMFEENGKKYHVTASFGLASARPANEKDFRKSGFIGKADQALYEAKRNGKNRIETLSPTPKPPTKKSFNPFKH